ncbi:hypothetical protein [Stutzerimonas zhaodongensis]|uniref:Uncharacterized protein n=1 Tax=Stutzerimonas zhaodongensis TaxID=1176257 RepID=A0A365PZM2_9GAMM|nr:hypothetical protein [Stutzerimonas zhaodongensis]QWV15273.1 hypothetical protein KQ248_11895 [Stutzerimonas zhaodongensis]RBA62336.1 hypothetical protein DQ403_01765 [Stutzerimonas zhaodongensis]
MSVGLKQVQNDAGSQPERTDYPMPAGVQGWGALLANARRVPLTMLALLLLLTVAGMTAEVSSKQEQAAIAKPAGAMPVLLMMTERPAGRATR